MIQRLWAASPAAFKSLSTYAVKWNIIKLSFAIGAIVGMLFMAILLTVPQALAALTGLAP
jgi:hypothetical protein